MHAKKAIMAICILVSLPSLGSIMSELSYTCLTLSSNYLIIGNLSSSSFFEFILDSSYGLPTKPQTVHYISERIIRNPYTFLLKFHSKPVLIWSSRFKPRPPLSEKVSDLHCMLAHSQYSVFIL